MSAPAATVFRRVQEHADRDPGAVALEGDGRSWTYGQLCRDAAAVGGGLLSLGLRAGDRVAVLASNHPETALLWLAGSRTGIVPVLVNPGLTDAELGSALGRLRPALLFADADHGERLAGIHPRLPRTPPGLGLARGHSTGVARVGAGRGRRSRPGLALRDHAYLRDDTAPQARRPLTH